MRDNGARPAPDPNPGDHLPPMNVAERKLWAATHRLPANMMLLSVQEMRDIRTTTVALGEELRRWRSLGKTFARSDDPLAAAVELKNLADEFRRLRDLEKTRFHRTADGSIVTGERAVDLLNSERASHAETREELRLVRAELQGGNAP